MRLFRFKIPAKLNLFLRLIKPKVCGFSIFKGFYDTFWVGERKRRRRGFFKTVSMAIISIFISVRMLKFSDSNILGSFDQTNSVIQNNTYKKDNFS